MSSDWRLGLRAFPRDKIFQPATLVAGVQSARVHMLDVSRGGAKIHIARAPDVGAPVLLAWAGQRRTAQVAWSAGNRCGLRFNVPLNPCQIAALLDTA